MTQEKLMLAFGKETDAKMSLKEAKEALKEELESNDSWTKLKEQIAELKGKQSQILLAILTANPDMEQAITRHTLDKRAYSSIVSDMVIDRARNDLPMVWKDDEGTEWEGVLTGKVRRVGKGASV
jgi:hypothetical protein